METVRTRFAPSPTGYLHIGGARTALYSWLHAHKHGGTFILRIEDTDRERSTQEAVDAILEGMDWLGLSHDEGPYYQTERFDRYRAVTEQLLTDDKAYYCYCSRERIDDLRAEQLAKKLKPRYDGRCRNGVIAADRHAQPVVRFKNPVDGVVHVGDQIHGTVAFRNDELDDLVIARSDGTPTYNFTVVVDDMDMAITDVIRGDDHLNNTPRQINILQALNAPIPRYAHVPMILGSDGKRLSKRHGAVSVLQYRDEGYLPQALLNYLVRLGWSYGDQEIFPLDELVEKFDIHAVNKAAASINPDKLLWLNQHYIKGLPASDLAYKVRWFLSRTDVSVGSNPPLESVVEAFRERAKTLVEMTNSARSFYEDFDGYDEAIAAKHLRPEARPILEQLFSAFQAVEIWDAGTVHAAIADVANAMGLKLGQVAQPLRVAVTNATASPPIDTTLVLTGKLKTLARLELALKFIATRGLP